MLLQHRNRTQRFLSFGNHPYNAQPERIPLNNLKIQNNYNENICNRKLEAYAKVKSMLAAQKYKNNIQFIKKKYVSGIDKEYLHFIISKNIDDFQQRKEIYYDEQQNPMNLKHRNQLNSDKIMQLNEPNNQVIILKSKNQSPYQQFKCTQTQPNTKRNSRQKVFEGVSKDLFKQSTVRKHKNKISRQSLTQQQIKNILKKIENRIIFSSVQVFPDKLANGNSWVKQMHRIYEKQRKQRKELKTKILINLNIL